MVYRAVAGVRVASQRDPRRFLRIVTTISAISVFAVRCQAASYTLTVMTTHGSVTTEPNTTTFVPGTVGTNPAGTTFASGTSVRLIPRPDSGYCFDSWSGDVTSRLGVIDVTMTGNKSITAHFVTWHAPIGIPEPNFGISETYRMYDVSGNRNPALAGHYVASDSGGYYTHYVDCNDPNMTDSSNAYGSKAKPRATIPRNLPAGSVVEVHHNVLCNWASGYCFMTGAGSAAYPIFIRGVDYPHIVLNLNIGNPELTSYMVVEGLSGIGANLVYSTAVGPTSHVCIRDCNFTTHGGAGKGIHVGTSGYSSNFIEYCVLYRNVIHDYGQWKGASGDNDYGPSSCSEGTRYLWVVDNQFYHTESIGFICCPNNQNISNDAVNCPHHIYVGRNTSYENKQDGVGTKTGRDIIFSQNTCWGHSSSSSSNGSGLVWQYDPKQIWYIFNYSFLNNWGITGGSGISQARDDIYLMGNVIHDCNSGFCVNGCVTTTPVKIYDNTIYKCLIGIENNYYPSSMSMWNNIIAHYTNAINLHGDGTTPGHCDMDYDLFDGSWNIVWGSTYANLAAFQSGKGLGSHCIQHDPAFVDANSNDFHLQAASQAIDTGTSSGCIQAAFDRFQTLYGINIRVDFDNLLRSVPWDIGAYEHVLKPVTDLVVTSTSQNSVTVLWTVPSGQGSGSTPTQYDIRYTSGNIADANWDTATQVQGEPAVGNPGDRQSFTITGLNMGTTYSIAMKADDAGGHASPLSNVVSATTALRGKHAPVMRYPSNQSVLQNKTITFVVSATDPNGETLTYSATNIPKGATFKEATRTFTWTPTKSQVGTFNATFEVSNGQTTVSQTVPILVKNVANRAPVLAPIGDKSVNADASLSFTLSATDEDGDKLTYSATDLPSGATLADGVFSWQPSYEQAGVYRVTFMVSDGELTDSKQITITVAKVTDTVSPSVRMVCPVPDAIQVPVNSLISLTISDSGSGVDASSVAIRVNDQLVYTGGDSQYQSAYGICRRLGTRASYRYYYHPAQPFDFDQQVSVAVSASDAAGNAMTPALYHFVTEMRSFGRNQQISSSNDASGHPAAATDSRGNIWAVWHSGKAGARSLYAAKRDSRTHQWSDPVQLTPPASDQCNPVLAVGPDDALYVAWQDNRRGNWDIYASVHPDGGVWQDPVRVTDSNSNHTNPAIAADHASAGHVFVAWEDDLAGNQDIYLASSSTLLATKTVVQITSDPASQTEPALAVSSDDTVYLVWTDQRNGSMDIYGSSSSAASRINVPIVTGSGNQSHPALAVEPGTSRLHLLWVDDSRGNLDILHGVSEGLPDNPIAGSIIVDDTTNADQSAPSIVATKDQRNGTHVYACWQDNRSMGTAHDSDLYFVEVRSGAGTNVLVGDDGSGSNQSDPVMAFDGYGQPAILWTDDRGGTPEIYGACSTYLKPKVLASRSITRSAGGRVGTDPAAIGDGNDVSIIVPSDAHAYDTVLSISQIENSPRFASPCVAGFEIGPSGVQFALPATVNIPYVASGSGPAIPYWYDGQTGTLSQQGISAIVSTKLANGMSVMSFKTTHLTSFYVLEGAAGDSSGGGGGGCALAANRDAVDPLGCLLPYGIVAAVLSVWRWRDRKAGPRSE